MFGKKSDIYNISASIPRSVLQTEYLLWIILPLFDTCGSSVKGEKQRVKVKRREAIETEVKCSQEEHSTQVDTEQQ